jgi:acetolactate synthase-1/2/3 large subunit
MVRIWRETSPQIDKTALTAWWTQIDGWRARKSLAYKKGSSSIIKPQYALERLL